MIPKEIDNQRSSRRDGRLDNTLLSRLGFSDPDKQNSRHLMACKFTSEEPQRSVIAKAMNVINRVPNMGRHNSREEIEIKDMRLTSTCSQEIEKHITKGEGKYSTTIGFADVMFLAKVEQLAVGRSMYDKNGMADGAWREINEWIEVSCICAIEVKIEPTPIDVIVRQVNLYREYLRSPETRFIFWACVLDFNISESDKTILVDRRITPIRLGKKFDEYILSKKNENQATIEEL